MEPHRMVIYVPPSDENLWKAVRVLAGARRQSVSAFVREALLSHVRKNLAALPSALADHLRP